MAKGGEDPEQQNENEEIPDPRSEAGGFKALTLGVALPPAPEGEWADVGRRGRPKITRGGNAGGIYLLSASDYKKWINRQCNGSKWKR